MKKGILYFGLIVVAVGIGLLFVLFGTNNKIGHFKNSKKAIYLEGGLSYDEFITQMIKDSIIESEDDLSLATKIKSFKSPKAGRYVIQKGMTASNFISMLRAGNQTPLMVKVDGVRTIYQMAGKLGKQLQSDSLSFLKAMTNPSLLEKYGLNEYTASSLIFPNTYEYFWTITPEEFMSKMEEKYIEYWTEENKAAAKNLGLSPAEVSTLASIVKGETVEQSEAPKIAGLYLNRLRIGMRLQADPTVTFASNLQNVKRVKLDSGRPYSPYDTYQNSGLPPGPIFFTEKVYLDAVLHAEKHNYTYMCAQPKGTGYHDFTTNLKAHEAYARVYRKWLDSINIR
ncbi:MAG: hypothetical protein RL204_387 [Bacteroidota bacterium]|jgi:UPF0755 protein